MQKIILPLMIIISLALLIPGVTQPMLSLKADINRQALLNEGKKIVEQQDLNPAITSIARHFLNSLKVEGTSKVYDKTRSIIKTADDLWQSGYHFVAVLIVTFSLVIPVLKLLLLLLASIVSKNSQLLNVNGFLSKWSMADVFAIGVLIAFLAANATTAKNTMIHFSAELHVGFYWFVAYCLVSNLAGLLASRLVREG